MLDNELDDIIGASHDEPQSHKRKSLGRGLGALLGDDDDFNLEALDEPSVENKNLEAPTLVDINLIKPSRFQPRTEFDEDSLNALAQSIKEKGVLQPLLVRKSDFGYELIAGERRWRASQIAGLGKVPVIEKNFDDKEVLEVALVENLLRENLSAIEEAEALQRLIDEFAHTQEALSQIIGKSRSYIANTLRLLNLPAAVKQLVKEGKLSAGHARQLIGLDNAEELAEKIIKKDMSVRQVEELVAKLKSDKKAAKPAKEETNSDIADIENSLKESLGLRIKISQSKQGGGKVVLQYASPAELDMIVDILEQKRRGVMSEPTPPPAVATPAPSMTNEKFSIKIID